MIETTNKVLTAIKEESEGQFSRLIGVELNVLGKNEELLHYDFKKLTSYYKRSATTQTLTPIILDTPNKMGQKAVQIILGKADSNSNTAEELKLLLYFGPPNLFGLDKITGYKIEMINSNIKNEPIIAPPPFKSSDKKDG